MPPNTACSRPLRAFAALGGLRRLMPTLARFKFKVQMKSEDVSQKVRSVWLGISIGALVSIVFGLVFLVVLHEPGSAFYPFTGLVFLAGPDLPPKL
jgi:hypothetical protein